MPNRNRIEDSADKDGFCREISPLKRMTANEELRSLVTHPVLSSFLYLKWSKLLFLFYMNLFLFSVFMVSFVYFVVLCQLTHKSERGIEFSILYVMSHIQLWILMLRELLQCMLSYRHYFKSPMNWFEITLIVLAWIVFANNDSSDVDEQRILRAVLILFLAFEFLQIIGTLPILMISTHMAMLKRVTITFLKSIALYSILLLSFGLCFFMLFGATVDQSIRDNNSTFSEVPMHSVIVSRFDEHAEDPDQTVVNATGINSASEVFPQTPTLVDYKDVDKEGSDFANFRYPAIAIVRVLVMAIGELKLLD